MRYHGSAAVLAPFVPFSQCAKGLSYHVLDLVFALVRPSLTLHRSHLFNRYCAGTDAFQAYVGTNCAATCLSCNSTTVGVTIPEEIEVTGGATMLPASDTFSLTVRFVAASHPLPTHPLYKGGLAK
jgi:hypothetical protein